MDRLKAIESRCEVLGWKMIKSNEHWCAWDIIVKASFRLSFNDNPSGLQAAERLLACYEPGAVVEVKTEKGYCSERCQFCNVGEFNMDNTFMKNCKLKLAIGGQSFPKPGPSCPSPGHYKLMRWSDE